MSLSIAAESDNSFEISSTARPTLVAVHNSCDTKVSSLAFISGFINLYEPVVKVDLTKPLAKYAKKNCPVLLPLYAALLIFLILEFSDFPGPATYSILTQYSHSIHLLSKKY